MRGVFGEDARAGGRGSHDGVVGVGVGVGVEVVVIVVVAEAIGIVEPVIIIDVLVSPQFTL